MKSQSIKELLAELNCLHDKRIIWIGSGSNDEDSGVDKELSRKVILSLAALDTQKEDNITLIINCIGGYELDGIAIYDAISLCRSHITGIVCGGCCSAASVFLQACDLRLMTPNSWMLCHNGSYDLSSEPARDAEINIKLFRDWKEQFKKMINIKANITKKELNKILDKDTWFTANQALSLGFIDKIINTWEF